MKSVARWLAPFFALGTLGADCGEPCTRTELPVAMTEARAKMLAPHVSTGLAVSTTHVYGDCAAEEAPDPKACGLPERCAKERGPFHVYVVSANGNLPKSDACPDGYATSDIEAVAHQQASAAGEQVFELSPGRYGVLMSVDGLCAGCGLAGAPTCLLDVVAGQITARDLVLDRATR